MTFLTPLKRIPTPKGEVRHGIRVDDAGFAGFGEAYISEIFSGETKGWKRHRLMTMNLIVLKGTINFSVYDESSNECKKFLLSEENKHLYYRLTVPPGLWMAFRGEAMGSSLVLNIASHVHDPDEAEVREINEFREFRP
ncbi:dTDP-4-dehydrorhamnose epimerase (plasmid) [Azospirillum sp. B510]|nr:dTDP-4-dehydrorhamnose epimerase [Azospirillum sp. B510]